MAEKKSRTSTEVKARYNNKAYDLIAIRVPKEMPAEFKKKCSETGTPEAQVIKKAIEAFLNETI